MTPYSKDFIIKKITKQEIPLNKIEKEALDYKQLLFTDNPGKLFNLNYQILNRNND
jgi:hypothetical protein